MDDDDFLYHVVTPSVHPSSLGFLSLAKSGEGIHQDFILLASRRRPCGSGSVQKTHDHDAQLSCWIYSWLCLFHYHQRFICDRSALCVVDLSPPHWRLLQGRGSLCWLCHTGHKKQHVTGKTHYFFYFKVALKPLTTHLKINSFFKTVVDLILFCKKGSISYKCG